MKESESFQSIKHGTFFFSVCTRKSSPINKKGVFLTSGTVSKFSPFYGGDLDIVQEIHISH